MLTINDECCTQCGICAENCAIGILSMNDRGPVLVPESACNACGHCVASCPQGALDHVRTPLANQEPLTQFPAIDPKTAATFLRSRRSIRCYQEKKIPRETIRQLLEIARFSPSGGNSQGLSYLVVEQSDILKKVAGLTADWLEMLIKAGVEWVQPYTVLVDAYRKGKDMVLRDAPCLILALAAKGFGMGRDNARLSLEYVELFATTLGLGTCWNGFVEMCAGAGYQPLLETLNIPQEMEVVGAMMAGYPKYTFRRLVDRNPLNITWL
jgi:nitroreductase/NAD-dependent dihydropyrimidine dehydrogenase PreA subunit